MVLGRHWNILTKNKASAGMILRCVRPEALTELFPDRQLNFMRLMFDPNGLRPRVRSWEQTAPILVGRLRRPRPSLRLELWSRVQKTQPHRALADDLPYLKPHRNLPLPCKRLYVFVSAAVS